MLACSHDPLKRTKHVQYKEVGSYFSHQGDTTDMSVMLRKLWPHKHQRQACACCVQLIIFPLDTQASRNKTSGFYRSFEIHNSGVYAAGFGLDYVY